MHLRAILRRLQLPEIEQFTVTETIQQAIDDHARKTGLEVHLAYKDIPDAAPLPVRIHIVLDIAICCYTMPLERAV